MKRVALCLAAILLLASCGPAPTPMPPSCTTQARSYIAEVMAIAREWDSTYALAWSTPRSALAPVVDSLREIRRKAGNLKPPVCADLVHVLMMQGMGETIAAFDAFLKPEPEAVVNEKMEAARATMEKWSEEMDKLIAGQPPYDR